MSAQLFGLYGNVYKKHINLLLINSFEKVDNAKF